MLRSCIILYFEIQVNFLLIGNGVIFTFGKASSGCLGHLTNSDITEVFVKMSFLMNFNKDIA